MEYTLGRLLLFTSEALLCILAIVPHGPIDPVPVEVLDLGRITILLAPEPPNIHDPTVPFQGALEQYTRRISDGPIPLRHLGWHILDTALCSERFSSLKMLRMDYVIFDNRVQHTPPEGFRERVEGLGVPTDWLFMTNAILPGVVAENRIKFEGRIIEMKCPAFPYDPVDYSTGVCRARYQS